MLIQHFHNYYTQSHPLINDVVIVIIRITGVPLSVLVQVFLSRVWHLGAVILQPIITQVTISPSQWEQSL